MNKIKIIIAREFLSRIKQRSFIIMTLLGPLLIAAIIIFAIWLNKTGDSTYNVIINDPAGLVYENLKSNDQFSLTASPNYFPEDQFITSEYDIMVDINENIFQNNTAILYYKEFPSAAVENNLRELIERGIEEEKLKMYNIQADTFDLVKTNLAWRTIDIYSHKDETNKRKKAYVGLFFSIFIYVFILLYGVQVMRGVIEEKTNRVVEVIVSSVKPFQLMMGKIIGVAMVGLVQFILWASLTTLLIGVFQNQFFPDQYDPSFQAMNGQMTQDVAIEQLGATNLAEMNEVLVMLHHEINYPLMIGMFLFFFLSGYLLYSALLAAIGSAVDTESDTQQFMMPITLPMLLCFLLAEKIITDPESTLSVFLTLFPLTAPVTVMMRLAMGFPEGTEWQLYTSMIIMIISFIICVYFAGKVYRRGILMYGNRIGYKDLFRWLRSK